MENLNKSFEPMDVDLSGRSSSAMDISYNNSATETEVAGQDEDCYIIGSSTPIQEKSPVPCPIPKTETNNMKKYHLCDKSQAKRFGIKSQIKILTFLSVLFISVIIYHIRIQCSKELNLGHLRETLTTQVFGQAKATESIIGALKADKRHKILFFYGGTGVGKTYTSSLIMDTVGPSSNLYHYTMPTFVDTFSSDLMLGLIMCDSTIIIIDDLTIDMNVSEEINMIIAKTDNLQKNITIILIHNCAGTDDMFHKKCDESFQSILLENYYNANAMYFFIKFETLTEAHLRKCIDKELGDVKLDEVTYKKIIKIFNVTSDGCKGVHTKVKLLNME